MGTTTSGPTDEQIAANVPGVTAAQVAEAIRAAIGTQREIAAVFGVSQCTVWRVKHGASGQVR